MRGRATAEGVRGAGIAGSLALHGLAIATFLTAGATQPRPPLLTAYSVQLLAAPAPAAPPVPQPTPATPAPPPARSPEPPRPAAAPAPSRTPSAPVAPPRTSTPAAPPASPPRPRAAATPAPAMPSPSAAAPAPASPLAPGATPGVGTDPTTVRTEGVEFPFPGYLRNLVAQVYRRWRPPSTDAELQAEVFFFVHRDGSVTGLQFIRRSGSFAFDLEAQGAVEAAARTHAFGSLPDGYGADVLPVSFFFSPGSMR